MDLLEQVQRMTMKMTGGPKHLSYEKKAERSGGVEPEEENVPG